MPKKNDDEAPRQPRDPNAAAEKPDAENQSNAQEESGPQPKPPPRGRQSAAPHCPYHKKTRCKAQNSSPYFTRYYCPRPGCTFSVKQPRPGLQRGQSFGEEEDFSAR